MITRKILHALAIGAFCSLAINLPSNAAMVPPSSSVVSTGIFYNTVLRETTYPNRQLNINSNFSMSADTASIAGYNIDIKGNGHTMNGSQYKGLVIGQDNSVLIDNLTLTNFKDTDQAFIPDAHMGGAIFNQGYLTVRDSTFSNNLNTVGIDDENTYGGAICNLGSRANFYNTNFSNNATEGSGGAIFNGNAPLNIKDSIFNSNNSVSSGGAIYTTGGSITVDNSTFTSNTTSASNTDGGAIYTDSDTQITNSTFTKNSAKSEGGAIMVGDGNTPIVEISDSNFGSDLTADANTAYIGGAISAENNTALSIKNSTFKNNSASWGGGAIYSNSGDLRISNSIFDANNALQAGGIFNMNESKIYDSSFINNTGGAICNFNANLYVVANNEEVLFANNTHASGYGGAINTAGNAYLIANTSGLTFRNNSATVGNDIHNDGNLYLNSGIGDITLNSGVVSTKPTYINSAYTLDLYNTGTATDNAPTTGRVVLNSALSGNGNVTVNGGMLQVGPSGSIGSSGAGNSIGDLTLSGTSILNLANRQGIAVEANNFIINDTPSIWMDANLSDNSSTAINSTWSGSGAPNFLFRIYDNSASNGAITITSDTTQDMTGISSIAYTNGYKYDFTGNTSGVFDYIQSSITNGYDSALADNTHNRSLSLVMGNITSLGSGSVSDNTLTIFGTGTEATDFAISGGADALKSSNKRLLNIGANGTVYIDEVIFKNGYNSAGGPISNAGNLYIYDSLVTGNCSGNNGGAIVNNGTTYVNGTTFFNNKTFGTTFMGGAVSNAAGKSFTAYNSDFNNNSANSGGAIYNRGNLIVSDSRFTDNSATQNAWYSMGGAIYNFSGNAKIYGSTFTNNITSSMGGAILNRDSALLTVYNSNFITNRAEEGGAIANCEASSGTSEASIYNSLFDRNETTRSGGAIYSYQAPLTIVDSMFTGNKTANTGGAIYSENSTLTVINSTFKANEAFGGGAIHDRYLGGSPTTAIISDSTFGGDLESDGNKASIGGALMHEVTPMRVNNSIFNHNSATNNGGAIYNSSAVLTLQNSKFLNNSAASLGGAIYNNVGTLNIISSNGNTIFSNNTTGTGSSSTPNDIYLAYGSTLNLNSSHGNIIYLGGGIKTLYSTNAIKINPTGILQYDGVTSAPTAGEVVLNGAISGTTAAVHPNVNLYNGTLTLNNDSNLNGSDLSLTYGRLNMINNTAGVMDLNSLSILNNASLAIDVDLANEVSDRITAKTASTVAGKALTVSSINLLSDSVNPSTTTQLIDSSIANNVAVTLGATTAYTPIYKYDISYDNSTGKLAFSNGGTGGGGGNFNPAVIATPVAAQSGAYVNQVNSYNQAFQNMDYTMLMPRAQRLAIKNANRYALLEGGTEQTKLHGLVYEEKNAGAWFQPFASFEKVSLNNGPKVNNTCYGSIFGGDSKYIELKRGWDVVYSGYAGYNGSNQSYSGNSIYQNGGQIGTGATFYKGNSFAGLTLNAGASTGESSTMYGKDNFNMLSSGLAVKTGHNFEFNEGKFIVQPSYMMSYTFVNTFDYTNAAGVKISSDPLNAIQIAPGVKLIANTKSGWQPYFGVEMLWNLMDKARYYANDVSLPEISVKPYVQYGLGVQKRMGERITGFGQAMVRNGGRNGIALSFGFRIAVGKDSSKL